MGRPPSSQHENAEEWARARQPGGAGVGPDHGAADGGGCARSGGGVERFVGDLACGVGVSKCGRISNLLKYIGNRFGRDSWLGERESDRPKRALARDDLKRTRRRSVIP